MTPILPDPSLPEEATYVPESLYDVLTLTPVDERPPIQGDTNAAIPVGSRSNGRLSDLLLTRNPLKGHRQHARNLTVASLVLMYQHSAECGYTEGSGRWPGLYKSHRASTGFYPRESDCSSSATWALWNGLGFYHVRDIVNGDNWEGGYTGTMVQHGIHAGANPARWLKGDALLFGPSAADTVHVALNVGFDRRYNAHMVLNHGGPGVQYFPWSDMGMHLAAVRRYI